MTRGKLIVIEGPDGSGKTTLCENISKELIEEGIYNEVISLPNEFNFGYDKIREYLKKDCIPTDILQSLMIVNMEETFKKDIVPRLNKNINIILDRWMVSTLIYNVFNNGVLLESMVEEVDEDKKVFFLDKVSRDYLHMEAYPDLIFYLSIPKSLIVKHAMIRSSEELNDKENNVRSIYNLYNDFYTSLTRDSLFPFDSKKFYISESEKEDIKDKHILVKSAIQGDDEKSESLMYKNMQNHIIAEIYKLLKQ